jgi:hypothetical protein
MAEKNYTPEELAQIKAQRDAARWKFEQEDFAKRTGDISRPSRKLPDWLTGTAIVGILGVAVTTGQLVLQYWKNKDDLKLTEVKYRQDNLIATNRLALEHQQANWKERADEAAQQLANKQAQWRQTMEDAAQERAREEARWHQEMVTAEWFQRNVTNLIAVTKDTRDFLAFLELYPERLRSNIIAKYESAPLRGDRVTLTDEQYRELTNVVALARARSTETNQVHLTLEQYRELTNCSGHLPVNLTATTLSNLQTERLVFNNAAYAAQTVVNQVIPNVIEPDNELEAVVPTNASPDRLYLVKNAWVKEKSILGQKYVLPLGKTGLFFRVTDLHEDSVEYMVTDTIQKTSSLTKAVEELKDSVKAQGRLYTDRAPRSVEFNFPLGGTNNHFTVTLESIRKAGSPPTPAAFITAIRVPRR